MAVLGQPSCCFASDPSRSKPSRRTAGLRLSRDPDRASRGPGLWDYLIVDPNAHRIYISRSTHVVLLNENTLEVIGEIPNTGGVHGIALAPELGKGFISDGGAAEVTVFNIKTLKTIGTVRTTGKDPDSILYDAQTKRVFTMNGDSNSSTGIDARTDKVIGTVPLGGSPETPALDGKGNVFVNISDKNSLLEFNARTRAVEHAWSVSSCVGPAGIAMDTVTRRIFIGCSDSNSMTIVNADTGKVITVIPIDEDTDASRFDRGTLLAFASCEHGWFSIIHEDSPDHFHLVANVKTKDGARTMALDPRTHHVFVVTADLKPAPPPTKENPEPRRPVVPGTFVILELVP